MISDILKKIGLKKEESIIYETCLEFGGLPAGSIAQKTNIPRTSIYVHAEKLIQQGFMKSVKKGVSTYFIAADPEHLLEVFERQKKKIQSKEDLIRENMSLFQSLPFASVSRPKVTYYEGAHYLETLYEKVKKTKTFMAYVNISSIGEHATVAIDMVAHAIQEKRIKAKEIIVSSSESKSYKNKYETDHHQIKLLPKGSVFHTDNIILDDRIFHVSYSPTEGIIALEVVSGALVETQRVMFEQVWKGLK